MLRHSKITLSLIDNIVEALTKIEGVLCSYINRIISQAHARSVRCALLLHYREAVSAADFSN